MNGGDRVAPLVRDGQPADRRSLFSAAVYSRFRVPLPSWVPLIAGICRYLPARAANSAVSFGVLSGFEPGGRGFESLPACQSFQVVAKIAPIDPPCGSLGVRAGLADRVRELVSHFADGSELWRISS